MDRPTPEVTAPEAEPTPVASEAIPVETLRSCIKVLEAIVADRSVMAALDTEERKALVMAAGRVAKPTNQQERRLLRAFRRKDKQAVREKDSQAVAATGLRVQRQAPVLTTAGLLAATERQNQALLEAKNQAVPRQAEEESASSPNELLQSRYCYVCKAEFKKLHFFYDSMCPDCGDFNFRKRTQVADLNGRVALLTGARLKIGFQAALMLLRSGCAVVVTTRFPRDAADRFSREPDFAAWKEKVQVYGIDLRHTPSVELLARYLERTLPRLDFIINNACQTVRRPPAFYAHLLPAETRDLSEVPKELLPLIEQHEELARKIRGDAPALSASTSGAPDAAALSAWTGGAPGMGLWGSARLSQVPYGLEDASHGADIFPTGKLDADLQQVDLRGMNSWRLKLADVPTPELLEVQLVNAIAPFILNSRLKPLMLRQRTFDKHIVNVSAMEGQFSRGTKTDRHPHTNMAKAALNMMTRTSAADYAKDGIYMNSVDTGWITDEDPAQIAARKEKEHDFQPPLDIVDGASRIVDPIFSGIVSGEHEYGKFLKDYKPTDW